MTTKGRINQLPRGLIHVPVTPFTSDNRVDGDTFGKVVEFLLRQDAGALCVNLHLAESLNLTLAERKLLTKLAVDVTAGRVPIIVNVSTPGTDQAIDLARHAEEVGADCIMAIAPYYWKPPAEGLYEHFAAIIQATGLPFVAYNSPSIMDGVGFSPALLRSLMERFPQFIGMKDASHNWETFLNLANTARRVRPDFGMFVGTEWVIPSLTLGGVTCMSVLGGVAPRFVQALFKATREKRLDEALELQFQFAELYQVNKVEYPGPTKAMWEIMGRPVGPPRLPNRPVSAQRRKDIEAMLDRMGFLQNEPFGW